MNSDIVMINREIFYNTELRRRVNFTLIADYNSFVDFYSLVREILSSLIEEANRLNMQKDAVMVEIRGDMVNIYSSDQQRHRTGFIS